MARLAYRAGETEGSPSWLRTVCWLLRTARGGAPGQPGTDRQEDEQTGVSFGYSAASAGATASSCAQVTAHSAALPSGLRVGEECTSSPAQATLGAALGGHMPHIVDADAQHHQPDTCTHTRWIPATHGHWQPSVSGSRPLALSLPTSGTVSHTATSHMCANSHDSLHPVAS